MVMKLSRSLKHMSRLLFGYLFSLHQAALGNPPVSIALQL